MKLSGLVVDDDVDTRFDVVETLARAANYHQDSFKLYDAGSAFGALKFTKATILDFAVVDYDLPSGLDGIQLAIKLVEHNPDLVLCMFTAKDESTVSTALREAFGSSGVAVQYKAKPVTNVEWLQFYDFVRKQTLRADNDALFDDLPNQYRHAHSVHEKLRLLNLIAERSARVASAIFSSYLPNSAEGFISSYASRPFIPASGIYNFAQEIAEQICSSRALPGSAETIVHLAEASRTSFIRAARFVLRLEDTQKHQKHTDEAELLQIFHENRARIDSIIEFYADLRNVGVFHKSYDSNYCDQLLISSRASVKIRHLEWPSQVARSGLMVDDFYIDAMPMILVDRCENCRSTHPFGVIKVSEEALVYGWSCNGGKTIKRYATD